MDSGDFANKNVPDDNINNFTPEFKIVKPIRERFVLVLDVSGSMGGSVSVKDLFIAIA